MTRSVVVDADSHIMEPADLWQEYMAPQFRDRALRINVDEFGLEYLDIDGKISIGYNGGTLGRIAGIDQTREWMMEHPTLPYDEIKNIAPGSVDPHARIKHLDKEGVDKTFLFPTLGLGWEAECEDPALSAAYCTAYNRWLVDFCSPYPDRLFPIAHITVRDVNEGVRELERAARDGMKGAFICPAPMNGIRYSHEYYDPFWATAQDLDMPITFHVVLNPDYPGRNSYPEDETGLGPRVLQQRHDLRRPPHQLHLHDGRRHLRKVPPPQARHGRNRLHLAAPLARHDGLQDRPLQLRHASHHDPQRVLQAPGLGQRRARGEGYRGRGPDGRHRPPDVGFRLAPPRGPHRPPQQGKVQHLHPP